MSTAVRCLYENKESFDNSADPIVDLRFERICGFSADFSPEA
jgi:hypothetical protein